MKKAVFFLLIIPVLFWGCSTEVDLLADWKEVPVVYGLIDRSKPKQYVRIQRAFLGPGNALEIAQQRDSIFYSQQLNVLLEELDGSENVLNTWVMQPETIPFQEPGDFYSGPYAVYSANTPLGSITGETFRIRVQYTTDPAKNAESKTALVNDYSFTPVISNASTVQIIRFNSNSRVNVSWRRTNAAYYQVGLKFYYHESYLSGSDVNKVTPEWIFGSYATSEGDVSDINVAYDPNGFYQFLTQHIFEDPNIVSRSGDSISYTVYAGSEELYTYILVNAPSTSVVQDRPTYTNIENGLGIFASRNTIIKQGLKLTNQTLDTLSRGHITCRLKFKDRNGGVLGCQ